MDDFPKATPPPSAASATSAPTSEAPKELSPEEKQLRACKEAISKLTVEWHFETVSFTQPLFPSVLKKLEDSGFQVSYCDYYTTKKGHSVTVTITDPGLQQAYNSGSSSGKSKDNKDIQDGLKTLFKVFMGSPSSGASFQF